MDANKINELAKQARDAIAAAEAAIACREDPMRFATATGRAIGGLSTLAIRLEVAAEFAAEREAS